VVVSQYLTYGDYQPQSTQADRSTQSGWAHI